MLSVGCGTIPPTKWRASRKALDTEDVEDCDVKGGLSAVLPVGLGAKVPTKRRASRKALDTEEFEDFAVKGLSVVEVKDMFECEELALVEESNVDE